MVKIVHTKGQSAIELVIILTVVFFFFVALLSVIYSSIEQKNSEKRDAAVYEIAFYLADEITLANRASNGYSREFTLPLTIINSDYNVSMIGTTIYIITSDEKHALSVPSLNVTGQPRLGTNNIHKENNTIYLNI